VTESEIQAQILAWGRMQPGVWIRRERAAEAGKGKRRIAKSDVGLPDLTGWVDGWALGIEVKDAKGTLSPKQEVWRERMVGAGCCWILARDVSDVVAGVAEFRAEKHGHPFRVWVGCGHGGSDCRES